MNAPEQPVRQDALRPAFLDQIDRENDTGYLGPVGMQNGAAGGFTAGSFDDEEAFEDLEEIESEELQPGSLSWWIDRVNIVIEEAAQGGAENLSTKAMVIGVLHGARALEQIAETLALYCEKSK
jgi:hypothetical protein